MFTLEHVIVNGILDIEHLSIPTEEVSCILGPSGSGKSTLLKLLNNLITPDKGEIMFGGKSLLGMDPVQLRRKVVMVPQTPVIFDGTIEENLQIGLVLSEKTLASKTVMEEILELFELNKTLNDPAEKLSGGEKLRLALARAVLMKPEVYLLDEPSSALDTDTAETVMQVITTMAKQNSSTIIMVTHSKEVAEKIADNYIDITKFSTIFRRKEPKPWIV